MAVIGLFYGSTDGATAHIAQQVAELFTQRGHTVELFDVAEFYPDAMEEFEYVILGIPTWDIGQLQADWEEVIDDLDELDLRHARIALFGLGDQAGYPLTFVDALAFLADRVEAQGARLVGRWPITGYNFERSWAVKDGDFIGLALDEINQPELTAPRLARWVEVVALEFGIE
ncbi:MAG: flavodoxin [Caldilineaceae bacterium]|nr:flavodoxin [Caldilineaceae bacterium]